MNSKKPFEKKALTYEQQLELLKGKGLLIDLKDNDAKLLMQHRNYYRLSAYWLDQYKDTEKIYFKKDFSMVKINARYEFDRKLRVLILEGLERLEISLRANLAYRLAHDSGNPHAHLDNQLFHEKYYYKILENIDREVKRAERTELFIDYHLKTYSEKLPPIWVCCEVMSLGNLSQFYRTIKSIETKQAISQIYSIIKYHTLESWLHCLTDLRNYCAHHSRVFNRSYPSSPKAIGQSPSNSDLERRIALNWNHDKESKIYNLLVIIFHLLESIPLANESSKLIREHCLKHTNYFNEMGFPENWSSLPFWSTPSHKIT